ncbi:hypothetical protein M501DRAFT_941433 [Patellaria atrata CBS 101060]|uniref:Uncharacterized protein n=1 Tax=Patellaria atrata CBS 101060 TaxID=1346257 RepID=A0A9P4S5P5_9PEZI|nr:hypothetical protein M501DRAFT_941433 [Patellaria atrata CBS 101060]
MFIEVPNPFKGRIIIGTAIRSRRNDPRRGEVTFRIRRREVIDALDNEEWRDTKAIACHALNHSRPFPITWLELLASATSIGTCNDYTVTDSPYHKARLIKVIEVAILDTILCAHIGHK